MTHVLGFSFDCEVSPSIIIKPYKLDASQKEFVYGWGYGWYPGNEDAATIIKDATAARDSHIIKAMAEWQRFHSTLFICHIRGASKNIIQKNIQPFSRSFAGHIGDRAPIVFPYFQAGYGIFLFEYRGYGDNPGTPNEKDNIRDAITAWNYLQQSTKPPHCIVAYGESLGTGVAVALAAQRKVSAVILQSPFTSLDNVAKHHYPFLPVSWLLQEHYNSLSQIAHINSPLFIIHGDVDSVIPIQNSYLLYQQAYSPKELAIAPGKSHNDLDSTWMANNVISFLRKNVHCSPNSST